MISNNISTPEIATRINKMGAGMGITVITQQKTNVKANGPTTAKKSSHYFLLPDAFLLKTK
jgi:hypothetical protein